MHVSPCLAQPKHIKIPSYKESYKFVFDKLRFQCTLVQSVALNQLQEFALVKIWHCSAKLLVSGISLLWGFYICYRYVCYHTCISTKFCCDESVFVRLIKFYCNIQTFYNGFTWVLLPALTQTSSIVTSIKKQTPHFGSCLLLSLGKTINSKKELTKIFLYLCQLFLAMSPLPVTNESSYIFIKISANY